MVCPGGDLVDSADEAAMGVSLLAEVEGEVGVVSDELSVD